jgi:hypothetical protein
MQMFSNTYRITYMLLANIAQVVHSELCYSSYTDTTTVLGRHTAATRVQCVQYKPIAAKAHMAGASHPLLLLTCCVTNLVVL